LMPHGCSSETGDAPIEKSECSLSLGICQYSPITLIFFINQPINYNRFVPNNYIDAK
jgi:hypothetical protein